MRAPKTVRKGAAHVRKNEMMGRAFCDCVSVHVVEHPDQSHQRSKVCAMGKVGCRRTVVDDDLDRE